MLVLAASIRQSFWITHGLVSAAEETCGSWMLKAASHGRDCLGNFWDFFLFQIKVPGNRI